SIQEVTEFLCNDGRMNSILVTGSGLVHYVELVVKLLASRSDFSDPGIMFHSRRVLAESLERCFLTTDNADVDREVPPDIFGARIDSNVLCIRAKSEFADCRHAMLADEDHDVGAGQGGWSGIGRQRIVIRKLTLHGSRLDDGDLGFLGQFL